MSDDDDQELDRELMGRIWRADAWNRYSVFDMLDMLACAVDILRLIAWLGRLAVSAILSIASGQ